MSTIVNKNDFAMAKLMICSKEVDDDDVFIQTMISMITFLLAKKLESNISNIIILPETMDFCVNASVADTIETVIKNRGKT